ncbi:MAG: hypothetical protein K2M46_13730 [Lachnospiraceae bacterium]|nr:hypothetical protein [Lachnospiraceae bacterium]
MTSFAYNFQTLLCISYYLDYWIENYCKINLKDTTVKGYEKRIKLYMKPAFRID